MSQYHVLESVTQFENKDEQGSLAIREFKARFPDFTGCVVFPCCGLAVCEAYMASELDATRYVFMDQFSLGYEQHVISACGGADVMFLASFKELADFIENVREPTVVFGFNVTTDPYVIWEPDLQVFTAACALSPHVNPDFIMIRAEKYYHVPPRHDEIRLSPNVVLRVTPWAEIKPREGVDAKPACMLLGGEDRPTWG